MFKFFIIFIYVSSQNSYIDIIIALNVTDNYTASGELYMDDQTKKGLRKNPNLV